MNSRLEPPAHYDGERREIWAETITRLTGGGRIFRANPEVLNTYVEAVRSHRQASSLLAKSNVMIVRDGRAVENPALAVQRRSADAIARASKALGLDWVPRSDGPIAEAVPGAPIAPRWCGEHKRNECRHNRQDGTPCHQWRLVAGLDTCRKHGGKSLAALREDGRARVLEAEARKLLYQRDAVPVANPLEALQLLAGRLLAAEEVIGEKVNELTSWRYEGEGAGEQLRAEIGLLERTMTHLGRLLVDIAKLNIEERLARVTEKQAQLTMDALAAAMREMGMSAAQQREARTRVARHLRAA